MIAAVTPAITPDIRDTDTFSDCVQVLGVLPMDLQIFSRRDALHRKLGHGVRHLLGEDGPKAERTR